MVVKKYAVLTAILSAVLLVSGCSSLVRQLSKGTIVYDESLSPEQSTLIVLDDTIYVLEYNGISVEDAWYPNGKHRINRVTLPAGETTLLFNFRGVIAQSNRTVSIAADDIELRFNFEAGQKYNIGLYTKSLGFFKNTEYGVAIWGYAPSSASPGAADEEKMLKSWKFGEV
jgi:hypothetical protein